MKIIKWTAGILLGAVLTGAIGYGTYRYINNRQQTKKAEEKINFIESEIFYTGEISETSEKNIPAPSRHPPYYEDEKFEVDKRKIAAEKDGYQYNALKERNPDCIGWISIPEFDLQRPIMWIENDNEHYLYRDIDGNYERRGTPFLDGFAVPEENLLIYGHNTRDKVGFGLLPRYLECEKEYPNIILYLYEKKYEFKVFSVCKISAEYDKDFYEFYGMEGETLKNFLEKAKNESLIQVEHVPNAKNKLLMLSTCEYSQENGRLIVLAEEIKPK